MRKFMLCTLFCISLLFLVPEMQAQALKSEMKIIEGTEYMVPNIDVLVYFLTCDMKEWEMLMRSLKYTCLTGEEDADSPVYAKGKMNDMLLGVSKNDLLHVASFDWFNYRNKLSLMDEFIASIEPYYVINKQNISYYQYKDWVIGVTKEESDGCYHENVTIVRKLDVLKMLLSPEIN